MGRPLAIALVANLALAGCMVPPAALDLSLNKSTEGQKCLVAFLRALQRMGLPGSPRFCR